MSAAELWSESSTNWVLLNGFSVKFDLNPDEGWEALIENKHLSVAGYGSTLPEALADLCVAIQAVIDSKEPAGSPSGSTNLRLPIELHAKIAAVADGLGISQNDLIVRSIQSQLYSARGAINE